MKNIRVRRSHICMYNIEKRYLEWNNFLWIIFRAFTASSACVTCSFHSVIQKCCFVAVIRFIAPPPSRAVSDCAPPVGDLAALVGTLNETNDFSQFVQSMRRQFKALC